MPDCAQRRGRCAEQLELAARGLGPCPVPSEVIPSALRALGRLPDANLEFPDDLLEPSDLLVGSVQGANCMVRIPRQ